MSSVVYVNGSFVPEEKASVSVFDHGFLYGDGVFEGIRAYGGRVFMLDEHIARLYRSARAILLDIPLSPQEMAAAVLETCRRNGVRDGYIRLVVSRGVGDLGLDPRRCSRPTVVIIADSISLYPEELYEKGMAIGTVATRRSSPSALDPQVKSLNYLNNILAKIEGALAGYAEVVLLNEDGFVTECTGDNIFIVQSGCLMTPPPHIGVLVGITRNVIIDLARRKGIPVREALFTRYDLYNADECFLTGTAAEAIPVVSVDGRRIGNGEPGPITRELIAAFRALSRSQGTPIDGVAEPLAAEGRS